MDRAFLEGLGLEVAESGGVVEAKLPLSSGQAFNPLTRSAIEQVTFTVMGDRLLYVGPAEFVGAQPINLAFLTPATRLEDLVVQTLNEHLFQLERRSTELTAMGVPPKVDPSTLQLTADLERPPMRFTIAATRTGQFKISRAFHDGSELTSAGGSTFELSEFRDRKALEDFLAAMFSDITGPLPPAPVRSKSKTPVPAAPEVSLGFKAIADAFGDAALPPRSSLEVVADLLVRGEQVRFAAARVQGQTFRGLLAGTAGKLWADRFELRDFKGIRALVSEVMGVPIEEIEVL